VPFTFSHPAAVLPLRRTALPLSALVAGSIAPDLTYFLPVSLPWATHTAVAVVTVDLGLAAAAWVLWHAVLSGPLLDAAPASLAAKLVGTSVGLAPRVRPRRTLAWTVLAFAVGAATHVLWDELTHPGRWGARHVSALAEPTAGMPGYRWAQYASGLLGLALIGVEVARWWRRTPSQDGPARRFRLWPLLVVAAVGLGGAAVGGLSEQTVRRAGFAGITAGVGAAAACAVALCLAWHVHRLRDAREGVREEGRPRQADPPNGT